MSSFLKTIAKNSIIRFISAALISVILAIIIFLILTYTGLGPKFVDWLMIKFGYDFWQGEDRFAYIWNFMIGVFLTIFITSLFFVFNYLSKKIKQLPDGENSF
jgi:ABC-type dipeptide/oligopeptide/nickel transport system permease subunit